MSLRLMHPAKNRLSLLQTQLKLGLLAAFLLILGLGAYAIRTSWLQHQQSAKEQISNLALALEQGIAGEVNDVELTLGTLADALELQLSEQGLQTQALSSLLQVQRTRLPLLQDITIRDAQGAYLLGRQAAPGRLDDRDNFSALSRRDTRQISISKPLPGLGSGAPVILFSRRYNDAQGRFAGLVSAALEVSALTRLLSGFNLGDKGFVQLRYDDLSPLSDRADTAAVNRPDPQLASPQVSQWLTTGTRALVLDLAATADAPAGKLALRRVAGTPLVILVGVASDDFLSGWLATAWFVLLQTTLLLLMVVVLARWLLATLARELFDAQRLRSVFTLSKAGFSRTTSTGQLLEFNPALCQMLGYGEDELRQRQLLPLSPQAQQPADLQQQALLEETGHYGPYRSELRCQDGRSLAVELSGLSLKDASGEVFTWSIIKDISAQLAVETALSQAKRSAELTSLAKSRFLATISHELLTPLNGMLGMSQLLMRPGLSEQRRLDFARTITQSGKALAALLGELIDLTQIEAGKLTLRQSPCKVPDLVRDVTRQFDPAARQKGLSISSSWNGPTGQLYLADPTRLSQMLCNLVSNAIKFTEAGSVWVSACELPGEGKQALLEFSVQDTGPGIAADKLKILFDAFSQVDNSMTRNHDGIGLGLSILKQLALRMGGEVGVQSSPGAGSRFWFRVAARPLATPAEAAPQDSAVPAATRLVSDGAVAASPGASPAAASAFDPRFALVVEDNPVNQQVIALMLADLGIRAKCVANGQEALDTLFQGPLPEVVLMDVHMPVMDGLEATQRIRQWEQSRQMPRLPIIAVTADLAVSDREHYQASGMDEVVFKPVRIPTLKEALARLTHYNLTAASP